MIILTLILIYSIIQFLYGRFFLTEEIQALKEVYQEIAIYIQSVDDKNIDIKTEIVEE